MTLKLHGHPVSYSISMRYSEKYGVLKQRLSAMAGIPKTQLELHHNADGFDCILLDEDSTDNATNGSGLTSPHAHAVIHYPPGCSFIRVYVEMAPPANRRVECNVFLSNSVRALKELLVNHIRVPIHHQVLMLGSTFLQQVCLALYVDLPSSL